MEKPKPIITPVNASHFNALHEGRLLLQQCANCDSVVYYPRITCPECLSPELEWVPSRGEGRVASFADVRKPQHPAFSEDVPIIFVAVELSEGPVVFGRASNGHRPLAIGDSVAFDADGTRADPTFPLFRLNAEVQ